MRPELILHEITKPWCQKGGLTIADIGKQDEDNSDLFYLHRIVLVFKKIFPDNEKG